HAVDAEVDQLLAHRVIARGDRSRVAEAAEILGGEKREAAERSQRARALAAILRTDGLGRILHDGDPVPRGDGVDRIHVRALTVEMHRHDRARTPADLLLDLRRIDVVVLEAHVDEYRTRAEAMHDSGGR